MKKLFSSIVIVFISLAFVCGGCSKEQAGEKNSIPNFGDIGAQLRSAQSDADGYVTLYYDEYINDNRPLWSADYSGVFIDGTSWVLAGQLFISNVEISAVSNGNKSQYQKTLGTAPQEMAEVEKQMGQTVAVNLTGGSQFPGFSSQVYVPERMYCTTQGINSEGLLHRSQNLSLAWEDDPDSTNNKVYIVIVCDNPGSTTNPPAVVIETDDDGQYTVDFTSFNNFQTGGAAVIHIGRGRSITADVDGKTVCITSIIDASSGPLEVVQ